MVIVRFIGGGNQKKKYETPSLARKV